MWLYPITKKFVKKGDKLYPLGEEVTKKGDSAYKVKNEYVKAQCYPPEDYYTWEGTAITGFSEKGQSLSGEISGIAFPERCTEIKQQAFTASKGFSNFNTVVVTENISKLGTAVFNGVTSLRTAYITENGESLSLEAAVFGGSSIEKFNISKRIVKLGASQFAGCGSLKKVTSSEREKELEIESAPFADCAQLEEAEIKGIKSGGNGPIFISCNALKRISFSLADNAVFNTYVFYGCNNVEEVVIDGNITTATAIFNGCTSENGFKVTVNGNWEEIPRSCFAGSSLKNITVNGVINVIGFWSFSNCLKLTEFRVPKTVTEISEGAFAGSSNAIIYVPEGVSVGNRAFEGVKEVIYY